MKKKKLEKLKSQNNGSSTIMVPLEFDLSYLTTKFKKSVKFYFLTRFLQKLSPKIASKYKNLFKILY